MNKERLLKVADLVEKGSVTVDERHVAFSLSQWFLELGNVQDPDVIESFHDITIPKRADVADPYSCNSVACIAGFAVLAFDPGFVDGVRPIRIEDRAIKLLDITPGQARALFTGVTSEKVTGAEAAACIRHFAETGKIEWSKFVKVKDPLDEVDIDDEDDFDGY